jgi:transposase InsO family protein
MKYEFMKENRNTYGIKRMAELLGVARSAYYKWLKNGRSTRYKDADEPVVEAVKKIQKKHKGRYGRPRIDAELRAMNIIVNQKRLGKLLKKHSLNAKTRKRFIQTTNSKHGLPVCENILARDFHAKAPGEKWVSDITYLWTTSGWLFFTVVIDLFDRKVIGWSFSTTLETETTTLPALEMAFINRKAKENLIFHSDRGVQYCARAFRDRLKSLCPSVRQSMSRKGNCWDNACAESFFKTLKRELETLNGKESRSVVESSVFEYVESYYNRFRRHSAIDNVAPVEVQCMELMA